MKLGWKRNPDFIKVYDNVLTSEQCNRIIKYFETKDHHGGVVADREYNPEVKESWEISGNFAKPSWVDTLLYNKLSEYVPQYSSLYPELNDCVKKWRVDPLYTIKKYDPGKGYYGTHCETSSVSTAFRILVWMFYFNTVTDRGGTNFNNYDRIIDAVEGRLVLWPAYWTHIHRGIISNTQTKYIASGWYSFDLNASEIKNLNDVLVAHHEVFHR
tara:strand:- start:359 stop:1000 length:642 start_codon:yes stop_codon:yes gene_type:complete